ncbi:hypothetical protein BLD44_003515 [Mastigocladus laminosus UU774]|nr:MAG: hypothetical protein C6Y22_00580 [Hapalosiphonaceae cyanobacterium JJU2]TBR58878.1 hypothetical protein B4U84_23675 [Westiellopsis prolifica IICB1]TFI55615.1 hypothetical protein BLD44_003515 [Mastigocladus laminosus UU774]
MAKVNYKLTGKYLPPQIFILGICFVPGVTEVSSEQLTEIRRFIKSDRLLQHYLEQKILIIQD